MVQGRADIIQHPFNMMLFANQVIAVSLFLLVFISKYKPAIMDAPLLSFVQIAAIYGCFILAKVCLEKIIATSFKAEPWINQYLYQKLTYRNLIGIMLWILNVILYYVWNPEVSVLLIVVAAILILNAISLFYSYKTNEGVIFRNFFYFILYLCALEISPYVILFKVFVA